MTYAALTEAVLALSGGLEPGSAPFSARGSGEGGNAMSRIAASHGAATALSAALTRTLWQVARRLPETCVTEVTVPAVGAPLFGENVLTKALTLHRPGGQGVSFLYAGYGTLTFGGRTVRLARETLTPFRLAASGDTLVLTPDAGKTLTVCDLLPFSGRVGQGAALPLLRGHTLIFDMAALCPRFAFALSSTAPGQVTGDRLTVPFGYRGTVTVEAALFAASPTADEWLAEEGQNPVPVPPAAAPLLPLGVAAEVYAAEPDLPVAAWRVQFEKGISALPHTLPGERVRRKRGWV